MTRRQRADGGCPESVISRMIWIAVPSLLLGAIAEAFLALLFAMFSEPE